MKKIFTILGIMMLLTMSMVLGDSGVATYSSNTITKTGGDYTTADPVKLFDNVLFGSATWWWVTANDESPALSYILNVTYTVSDTGLTSMNFQTSNENLQCQSEGLCTGSVDMYCLSSGGWVNFNSDSTMITYTPTPALSDENYGKDGNYSLPQSCIDYAEGGSIDISLDISLDAPTSTASFFANELDLVYEFSSNTEPVINSITPSTRVELTSGESQVYTSDVTDTDGDASYSWVLGGVEVSTSETYTANWDDITAGIYTLTLYVSDAEYNNSASTTLEIRARGGSGSGSSTTDEVVDEEEEQEDDTGKISPTQQSRFTQVWNNIVVWFRNLFN